MTTYHLDWETRSEADLEEVGLDRYMSNPSTEIIMANFAEGDHKVKRWEPHLCPKMPNELYDALTDPFVIIEAHNAQFERLVIQKILKINKPASEFRCTMVKSRYLSLPGNLHDAGTILGLDDAYGKLKTGDGSTGKSKWLIKRFCVPEIQAGLPTLFGPGKASFRDWSTDPEDWQLFCEYGTQDVVAERALGKKLDKFPVPDLEWQNYVLNQKIGDVGWPVDNILVSSARQIVVREMDKLILELKEITGLDNPNSNDQILAWVQDRGYSFTSLGKAFVARSLAGECNLSEAARTALTIRMQTSKSSVKKYTAIADTVGDDGRLRHAYQFMGAARTGRESSLGVNVANLPKPTKQVERNLDRAVRLVREMDYDAIVREFGKPLEVVTGTLRSSFRAPKGKRFVVADLAGIEARGLAYLSRSKSMLNMFRSTFTFEGKEHPIDPYLDFATRMYKQSYLDLWIEWKVKGDATKRNNSKPPVLGAGYALSPGSEEIDNETGVKTWSGLMGYARAVCGVEMSQEDAVLGIKVYRDSYPEVKNLWYAMVRAAAWAIRHPGKESGVGDNPIIFFRCHGKKVLEMILPSGRSLHYIDPRVEEVKITHNYKTLELLDKPYTRDEITYQGKEPGKQQWGVITTHGGKLVENGDQALSRDILFHGMRNADEMGFEIVGSSYDEIITLVDEDGPLGVEELCQCMVDPPSWCGKKWPLAAEGFSDIFYRKN